ncbi:MAG: DUF2917 domain-containing protein [Desulfuromonadales bacterium]|nr:DUF2917 domain-containing protein [Desulfuromonadales bacterium]
MELLLGKQEMLDLGEDIQGINITCRQGRCWITQTGDSRDHILGVDGRFTVNTSGQLIITATEPCRLRLNGPGITNQGSHPFKALNGLLKVAQQTIPELAIFQR